MTSIPVQKGPVPPPPAATAVVEKSDNPAFAGMQKSMETELEKRRKDWEKDVERMQQDFFQLKKPSEGEKSTNGPSGPGIIDIKNSKSIFSDGPDGSQMFRHRFDMHGFNPEEISVSVDGRRITVSASLMEEKGGHKSTRNFNRQVDIPENVDPDKLNSYFSDEGILTVEAPVEPGDEDEENSQGAYLEYGLAPGTEISYSGSGFGAGSGFGVDGSQYIPAGSGGYSYYRSSNSGGLEPPGYNMVRTVETSGGLAPGGRQVEIRSSNPRRVVVRSRPTRTHSPPNVIYRCPSPNIVHHTTTHRSVSPNVSRREVVYRSGGSSPSTTSHVYRSSSPSTHIFGSSSPSQFLSSSPTALLSSSPTGKSTYYHSSSSSGSPSLSLQTTTSNKPVTSSGLSIGRFSSPAIVNLQNSKKFKLGVDLGTGYESPEVIVKLLPSDKIHVQAKHEEITEGRTSKREFSREFDVPESIEANTLRASLDSQGRLHIGASISANKNHVEALNSVMDDMPPDAEPCRIEI